MSAERMHARLCITERQEGCQGSTQAPGKCGSTSAAANRGRQRLLCATSELHKHPRCPNADGKPAIMFGIVTVLDPSYAATSGGRTELVMGASSPELQVRVCVVCVLLCECVLCVCASSVCMCIICVFVSLALPKN